MNQYAVGIYRIPGIGPCLSITLNGLPVVVLTHPADCRVIGDAILKGAALLEGMADSQGTGSIDMSNVPDFS